MKTSRIDIATIRKEQIVEAAVAVIAEQGLHNLSLSEIENKAGMKRGQLTYYFRHKEDILLAVFDRVIQLMYQRLGRPPGVDDNDKPSSGWEVTRYLLEAVLTKPPLSAEFHCLQYTFLSQIGYREDFRQRLATLYDEWRSSMAAGFAADLGKTNGRRKVPKVVARSPDRATGPCHGRETVTQLPQALATLVQAILHGLAMQAAADPKAFDGPEMLSLCLDMLGNYLGMTQFDVPSPRKATAKAKPGSHSRAKSTNGTAVASRG